MMRSVGHWRQPGVSFCATMRAMATPPAYSFNRGTGRLICGAFAFVLFVITAFILLVTDHGAGLDLPLGLMAIALAFLALAVAV